MSTCILLAPTKQVHCQQHCVTFWVSGDTRAGSPAILRWSRRLRADTTDYILAWWCGGGVGGGYQLVHVHVSSPRVPSSSAQITCHQVQLLRPATAHQAAIRMHVLPWEGWCCSGLCVSVVWGGWYWMVGQVLSCLGHLALLCHPSGQHPGSFQLSLPARLPHPDPPD